MKKIPLVVAAALLAAAPAPAQQLGLPDSTTTRILVPAQASTTSAVGVSTPAGAGFNTPGAPFGQGLPPMGFQTPGAPFGTPGAPGTTPPQTSPSAPPGTTPPQTSPGAPAGTTPPATAPRRSARKGRKAEVAAQRREIKERFIVRRQALVTSEEWHAASRSERKAKLRRLKAEFRLLEKDLKGDLKAAH